MNETLVRDMDEGMINHSVYDAEVATASLSRAESRRSAMRTLVIRIEALDLGVWGVTPEKRADNWISEYPERELLYSKDDWNVNDVLAWQAVAVPVYERRSSGGSS